MAVFAVWVRLGLASRDGAADHLSPLSESLLEPSAPRQGLVSAALALALCACDTEGPPVLYIESLIALITPSDTSIACYRQMSSDTRPTARLFTTLALKGCS